MNELVSVRVVVNGETHEGEVEPRLLLSDFLRHEIGLTGTHVGCEHGVCGACTILLDGEAVRSCLLFAVQADGHDRTTVEGLAADATALHPLQQAFWDKHGLQCGFCTPGILLSMLPFLQANPDPSEREIREALSGNLCRCTGYQNIVDAVQQAARRGGRPGVGAGRRRTTGARRSRLQPHGARHPGKGDYASVRDGAGLVMTTEQLAGAQQARGRLWMEMYELSESFDFLLTPCMAVPPFPVGENYPKTIAGKEMNTHIDWVAPTFILSLTGLPIASVPAGLDSARLPVGLQVVGGPQREEAVLAVVQEVQAARPIGGPPLR